MGNVKYRLKRKLPGFEKGAMFYVGVNDRLLPLEPGLMDMAFNFTKKMFEMRSDMEDWFELVEEDRIELKQAIYKKLQPPDYYYIRKKNNKEFTESEIELMEKALNGELFTATDLTEFTQSVLDRGFKGSFDWSEVFDDWLKYRES